MSRETVEVSSGHRFIRVWFGIPTRECGAVLAGVEAETSGGLRPALPLRFCRSHPEVLPERAATRAAQ
jgi:hypothetical protein